MLAHQDVLMARAEAVQDEIAALQAEAVAEGRSAGNRVKRLVSTPRRMVGGPQKGNMEEFESTATVPFCLRHLPSSPGC